MENVRTQVKNIGAGIISSLACERQCLQGLISTFYFFLRDGSFRPRVPAVMSLFIIPQLVSVLGNWLVFLLLEGCG